MKILVIGNSHVSCLKLGWEAIKSDFPTYDISFVAARGTDIEHFKIEKGIIFSEVPHVTESIKTTFGEPQADLNQIDPSVVLFFGMWLGFPHSLIDGYKNGHYSKNFLEVGMADLFNTIGYKWVARLSEHIQSKMFMSMPLKASSNAIQIGITEEAKSQLQEIVEYANNLFLQKLNVQYILQPLETFSVYSLETYLPYSINSQRLLVDSNAGPEFHPVDDFEHMNEKFGAVFLSSFITKHLDRNQNEKI